MPAEPQERDSPSRSDDLASCVHETPKIPDHEVLRIIDRGSYGQVWLARNVIGTDRAIKVVFRDQFEEAHPYEREFKGIQKFEPISRSHDGLTDVLQIGRNDERGYFYYVMELADDASHQEGATGLSYAPRTLRSELRRRGKLPIEECIEIGSVLISALQHLHRSGLVHRDIKPSNIIFVKGAPKLADIGLVAEMSEARSFVGTLGYIPPEGPGTPRADLYSLGKVLYEMATGKDRNEFPRLPSDLADHPEADRLVEYNEVLLRACEADPNLRYQGAEEMLRDLEVLRRGESVKRQRRMAQLRKCVAKAGAGLGLAALIALGFGFAARALKPKQVLSSNPRANVLYEHAWQLINQARGDLESFAQAFTNLNEAVRLDPRFIDAYYLMFESYWEWGDKLPPRMNSNANYQWVIGKMRALAPESAQYHTAMAYMCYLRWDWEEEIDHLKRALRADPGFLRAHGLYAGVLLRARGDPIGALEEFRLAEEIAPQDSIIQVHLATPYYFMRDYAKAIAQIKWAMKLSAEPRGPIRYLAMAYEGDGQYEKALEIYEQVERKGENANVQEIGERYNAWRAALDADGPPDLWRAVLRHYQQNWPNPFYMARMHARLREKEKAIRLLEKAYEARAHELAELLLDDAWDPLRDEPGFQEVIARVGLQSNWDYRAGKRKE